MQEPQRMIPVYQGTRDRAREMKGNRSYDEWLTELMEEAEAHE